LTDWSDGLTACVALGLALMLKTDTSDVDYEEISRIILYIRPITLRCTHRLTQSSR